MYQFLKALKSSANLLEYTLFLIKEIQGFFISELN